MLVCILIIANNFIIFPYASLFTTKVVMLVLPDWLWKLMMIGVGGYVGGRTVEKVVGATGLKLPWGKKE
jgi:predicted MFS family arabinose efflux permease